MGGEGDGKGNDAVVSATVVGIREYAGMRRPRRKPIHRREKRPSAPRPIGSAGPRERSMTAKANGSRARAQVAETATPASVKTKTFTVRWCDSIISFANNQLTGG